MTDAHEIMDWQKEIMDWQKRFREASKVYVVYVHGEISNLYESREAAELEVAWHRRHTVRASIGEESIHTLQLARERWT
jgi:hypothetical protein